MLDDILDARVLGWQKARLADLGCTALVGSPTDFGKPIAEETEKWGKVTQAAHIKARSEADPLAGQYSIVSMCERWSVR